MAKDLQTFTMELLRAHDEHRAKADQWTITQNTLGSSRRILQGLAKQHPELQLDETLRGIDFNQTIAQSEINLAVARREAVMEVITLFETVSALAGFNWRISPDGAEIIRKDDADDEESSD